MIFSGVRYDLATGEILGHDYGATTVPYTPPAGVGWLDVAPGHPALQAQDAYHVVAGELVPKAVVTLTASAGTFPADGVTECQVTASGLTADAVCWILPTRTLALPAADPVLVITSDVPRRFVLQVLDPAHWSAPLTVEAV